MCTEDEWARVVDAAGKPQAVHDRRGVLGVAATLGLTVAPGMAGCSVTVRTGEGFKTLISANDLAIVMDGAQYDAGAGPCLTAAREGRIERLDAAQEQPDYPGFAAAATRLGVRSSLSLPLPGGPPAALNFYAEAPGAFGPRRPQAVAELLARCMTLLLNTRSEDPIGWMQPGAATVDPAVMADAWARRRVIHGAEEALMVRDRLSRADAFRRLARRSKGENRSVFAVAADVLVQVEPGASR